MGRGWFALMIVLMLAVSRSQAASPPLYHVTYLGSLGGGGGHAYGINDAGQVVGTSSHTSGNGHAFRYSGGVMTDLGTFGGGYSDAEAINNSGRVTGSAYTTGNTARHAFHYPGSGSINDLGTLIGTGSSIGVAINTSGQIVGQSWVNGVGTHAFLYSGGTMSDLGTIGGSTSGATDINDAGVIVGSTNITPRLDYHAFRYADGVMSDLGTFGGSNSEANAINSSGQIVGSAYTENQREHAFLYSGGTMTDLGSLGYTSVAYDINDAGDIVGHSTFSGPETTLQHAFLYHQGVMYDLNNLLDSTSQGWVIDYARGINTSGWICGSANGQAVLLTPVPEPGALSVTLAGGMFLLRRSRHAAR